MPPNSHMRGRGTTPTLEEQFAAIRLHLRSEEVANDVGRHGKIAISTINV
jgi:hypothetical protein